MPIPRRNSLFYPNVPTEIVSTVKRYGNQVWKKDFPLPAHTIRLKLDHSPRDLMDALSQGIAYQVVDGKVYIWYKPKSNLEDCGYYLLTSYEVLGHPHGRSYLEKDVRFTLSAQQKL